MSQASGVDISYNFEPDTTRLIPKENLKAKLTMRFSADGVLDFDDLLAQLLACVEQKMGKIKQISPAGRENLKTQIARHVVATSISDVLNAFHDDGEPYWDADGKLHLSLSMQVSGRKLDLAPTLNASGELDCEALVESLEESYRGVMSEVIV